MMAAKGGPCPIAPAQDEARAFEVYLDLLKHWSRRINLVAPGTLADAKARHIDDSLQLLEQLPELQTDRPRRWVDLGSGAGFPGLPAAIASQVRGWALDMHLVESDQRKAAFLRTVSRETGTPVTIHAARIEALEPLAADIVSARALALLPALLPLVHRHLGSGGLALLPKGRSFAQELLEAQDTWRFSCDVVPSRTDPEAVILKIGDLAHV